jgi:hypothetical protein
MPYAERRGRGVGKRQIEFRRRFDSMDGQPPSRRSSRCRGIVIQTIPRLVSAET